MLDLLPHLNLSGQILQEGFREFDSFDVLLEEIIQYQSLPEIMVLVTDDCPCYLTTIDSCEVTCVPIDVFHHLSHKPHSL